MPIEANVTGASQITATVGESVIDVSVGGGVGPTGSQGSSGVVSVSAPLVNGGSASAAQLSLSVGAGLQVSGGSLALASHTHTASQITDFNAAVVAAAPPTTNASLLTSGTLPASRLPASGVAAGTYSSVTVDTTGRVTAGGTHTVGWSDVTNKPAEFPPSSHTHAAGDITSGRLTSSRLPLNPDFSGNATFAGPVTFQGGLTGESWSLPGNGNATLASVAAGSATLDTITIPKGVGDYTIDIGNGVISADAGNKEVNFNAGTITNLAIDWDYVTSKPSTFTPSSHTHGSITNDGKIGTTSGLVVTTGASGVLGTIAMGTAGQVLKINSGATGVEWVSLGSAASASTSDFAAAIHTHGSITNSGAIGTTSGLIVITGVSGVLGTLAMGTAGQVLKINSGATGVEWGSAAADVSIDTTAADILSASSGSITADDAGSDKLVFWDDSAGKLTYLSAGTNITITDTTISAAGSTSASDLTSGTLAYARMADPTVTSPSQITSNQNDYASFARGINRFTTNAARDITGMVAGSDGEVRVLCNVGTTAANTLTIKDESSSSTAANRFSVPWNGDCVIPAEGSVVVFYDGTSSRWRVV